MERLQKAIAASGAASRRQAEVLIEQGRVTVNGKIASLGMSVEGSDRIIVDGKKIERPDIVTYIFNKPVGVVCSRKQQASEKLVTDFVPKYPPVYPIGRLDKESGGLLLLSNDGALTQRITHPSFKHTKQYRVIASWKDKKEEKTAAQVEKELLAGVKLSDGKARADKAWAKVLPDNRLLLTLTVHEGRHHLIRRMCAVTGLKVVSLVRTHIASLELGNLQPGSYRILSKKELASL